MLPGTASGAPFFPMAIMPAKKNRPGTMMKKGHRMLQMIEMEHLAEQEEDPYGHQADAGYDRSKTPHAIIFHIAAPFCCVDD